MQNNNQPGKPGNPAGQDRQPPQGRQAPPGAARQPGQRQGQGQPAPRQGQRPAGRAGQSGRIPASKAAGVLTGKSQPPPPDQPEKKGGNRPPAPPKRSNRWFTAILMVLVTLAGCGFLSLFVLETAQDLFGLNQPDQSIEFTVPEGATVRQVADLLAEKGIITQPAIFNIYAGLKVEENGFKAGKYNFNTNMGYDQLIVNLEYGNIIRQEVRVTFIEGLTLQEIADKLEENKVCDADEFIDYLETAELDYEFVDRMPTDTLRFRRMEGYVFPDTYDFWVDESPKNVAAKFLDNFQRRITEDMEAKMMDLGLTLDETIILASIIQKEAGHVEDMRNVSSAFHNRMDDSATYPKLESDVTIFYVEERIKPYITHTNQTMYDAYNTYVCDGLPTGPICNPGLDAIEAALNPEDTDYHFFVTDRNGKFYFSRTVDEHDEMVAFAKTVPVEIDNPGEVHGTGVQGND